MAAELILRNSCYESVKVILSHNINGDEEIFLNSDSSPLDNGNDITTAIGDAQKRAISLSGDKTFAVDYTIKIRKNSKNVPNVTLVDLPGFTNVDKLSDSMCKTIVSKYMEKSGTLVLHMSKADQDYDTVLSNDFVEEKEKAHNFTKILVLTHSDILDHLDVEKSTKRIESIIKKQKNPDLQF